MVCPSIGERLGPIFRFPNHEWNAANFDKQPRLGHGYVARSDRGIAAGRQTPRSLMSR
jgi:hypothetical protein